MPSTPLEFAALADALLPSVLAAGALELGYFRSGVVVNHKSDASPVTVADQEAEAIILAALHRIAPNIPVIAEEAASRGELPTIGSEFFLVDPLDGTREFVSGSEEFTVNIALVRNNRPYFGIVYAPATGQMFIGLGDKYQPEAAVQLQVPLGLDSRTNIRHLAELNPRPIQCRSPDMAALTVPLPLPT